MSFSPTPPSALRWLIDLRGDLPPIAHQGLRGTCLAWAATTAHQHAATAEFSVEYLHWASGPRSRGTQPGLRRALLSHGQPDAIQWPYDPDIDDTAANYHPPATVIGPFRTASIRSVTRHPADLAAEMHAGRLAVAALRVTPGFLQPSAGVIHGTHRGVDGHAVTIVGVAQTTRALAGMGAGEYLLCVRNSWGPTWGIAGYALLTQTAWEACGLYALIVEPTGSPPHHRQPSTATS